MQVLAFDGAVKGYEYGCIDRHNGVPFADSVEHLSVARYYERLHTLPHLSLRSPLMGTRSVLGCLALALVVTACGDQQQPESMAGPSLAGQPNPAACNPNSLNSLISGYFPGGSTNVIKGYKD